MSQIKNDNEYANIVGHILENEEFNKIRNIEHHGISRFDHSVKVSYYSYKVAKALKLDYYDVARAGLLHDFFLSNDERTLTDRFLSTFVHPKKAEHNANQVFGINNREADIIRTHMFPVNLSVPRYAESWVVNFVDKVVGAYEFSRKFGYKLSYATNLYLIFLFNSLK